MLLFCFSAPLLLFCSSSDVLILFCCSAALLLFLSSSAVLLLFCCSALFLLCCSYSAVLLLFCCSDPFFFSDVLLFCFSSAGLFIFCCSAPLLLLCSSSVFSDPLLLFCSSSAVLRVFYCSAHYFLYVVYYFVFLFGFPVMVVSCSVVRRKCKLRLLFTALARVISCVRKALRSRQFCPHSGRESTHILCPRNGHTLHTGLRRAQYSFWQLTSSK